MKQVLKKNKAGNVWNKLTPSKNNATDEVALCVKKGTKIYFLILKCK